MNERTQFGFFMPAHRFFEALSRVVAATDVPVVFQRFQSDEFERGVHVVPPGSDLAAMHRDGGFDPIYLSVDGLPEHETDWNFIERCDVVAIQLGRAAPGQIGLSEVFLLGWSARLRALFKAVEHEIAAHSHPGVGGRQGERGRSHVYRHIYWSDEVRHLALYGAMGKEASRFWIVEDSG